MSYDITAIELSLEEVRAIESRSLPGAKLERIFDAAVEKWESENIGLDPRIADLNYGAAMLRGDAEDFMEEVYDHGDSAGWIVPLLSPEDGVTIDGYSAIFFYHY